MHSLFDRPAMPYLEYRPMSMSRLSIQVSRPVTIRELRAGPQPTFVCTPHINAAQDTSWGSFRF